MSKFLEQLKADIDLAAEKAKQKIDREVSYLQRRHKHGDILFDLGGVSAHNNTLRTLDEIEASIRAYKLKEVTRVYHEES